MENQSGPPFTVSDTITAIVLSMRELGLKILLSPEFQAEDVDIIMARVDAIIQQQRAGHINLECGLVATTFQHHCDVVLKKRRSGEALEEAEAVAGYAELERRCAYPEACNQCEDDEEIIRAEKYVIDSEADIEAARAFLNSEDTLLAHDIAVGEAQAESLALEDHLLFGAQYHVMNFPYECGCEGRYGYDDDGEIIHYDCP